MAPHLPLLGFGTMLHDGSNVNSFAEAISVAMKSGYRHFDTAEMYDSLPSFKKAIDLSGASRKKLFITSKLCGLPVGEYAPIKSRVENILQQLGVENLDLLLIHWPGSKDLDLTGDPVDAMSNATFDDFKNSIAGAWANMIQLRNDGLTKQIGVSNFYQHHMEELLKIVTDENDKPFANEIYIDLAHPEYEYVSYLQRQQIEVISYRSICFVPVYSLVEDFASELQEVINSVGIDSISQQQFILAWLMKRNIHVIPKSTNSERISSNFKALQIVPKITKQVMESCKKFENNEMVVMCGGEDEYAKAFKNNTK